MADNRLQNMDWAPGENGKAPTWERVIVAVLMDIRDELQKLNGTMGCHNTQAIPGLLRRIARNTTKRKRAKK